MMHSAEAPASLAEMRSRLRRPSLLLGVAFCYAFGALTLWNTLGCDFEADAEIVINGDGSAVCSAERHDCVEQENSFVACVTATFNLQFSGTQY